MGRAGSRPPSRKPNRAWPRSTRPPAGRPTCFPSRPLLRARILGDARALIEGAGFGQIDTPIFEDTDLFVRTVGEATDIVRKEMYTFTDQGGRSLTLRPEGTAPVCRAYLEHGMHKLPQPVKLWYVGPMFRYERAQAGRYRQHRADRRGDDRVRRSGRRRGADRRARAPLCRVSCPACAST